MLLDCNELDDEREEKLRGRVTKIHKQDGEGVREIPAANCKTKDTVEHSDADN